MFYKECVQGELSGQQVSKEGRESMMDILHRMNKEEEEEDCDSDDSEDEFKEVDRTESDPEYDLTSKKSEVPTEVVGRGLEINKDVGLEIR